MSEATVSTPPRDWLGLAALVLAMVSVAAFIVFSSITGQVPKSLAYAPSLPYVVYTETPLISFVAGAASVIAAIIALWRGSTPVWAPVVGAILGIALFNAVMVFLATVIGSLGQTPATSQDMSASVFPYFYVSPPAAAMSALLIGVAAAVAWMKGASGRRAASAALVLGGVAPFYWLFNLVWGLNAG